MINPNLVEDLQTVNDIASELDASKGWEAEINACSLDPRLKAIASIAIKAEQDRIKDQLRIFSEQLPYGEIGRKYINLINRLGEICLELDRIESLSDTIYRDSYLIFDEPDSELLSLAAQAVVSTEYYAGLELEQDIITDQIHKYEQVIEHISKPWPVINTQIASSEVEVQLAPKTSDEEEPKELLETHHTLTERQSVTYKVEAPQATKDAVEYVASRPGQVITIEELITVLYGSPPYSVETDKMRDRVTTIFGPTIKGETIRELLDEHKLTLQYGRLITKNQAGSATRTYSHRVYRVVPYDKFGTGHTKSEQYQDGRINWEITKHQKTLLEAKPASPTTESTSAREQHEKSASLSERLLGIMLDNLDKPISYVDLAKKLYTDEHQTDIRTLVNRVQVTMHSSKSLKLGIEKNGIEVVKSTQQVELDSGQKVNQTVLTFQKKSEKAPEAITDQAEPPITNDPPVENSSVPSQKPTDAVKKKVQQPEEAARTVKREAQLVWEPTARNKVGEIIALFRSNGLLEPNGQARPAAIKISKKEVLSSLLELGIIDKIKAQTGMLDLRGAIAAFCFTSQGTNHLFGNTTSRRILLEIIDEEVQDSLSHQVLVAHN